MSSGTRSACGTAAAAAAGRLRVEPVLDDALMRATVHDDNRGARLGADDMAGGRALYGPGGGDTLERPPSSPRSS